MAWRRERRFVIIWPIYFDKDKSRSNGRKVSKKYAVNKPNIALLSNIIKKLGYDFEVDTKAKYPAFWYEEQGRLIVFTNEKKSIILRKIGKELRKINQ